MTILSVLMRQNRFKTVLSDLIIFKPPKTFSSYYLSPKFAIQVATFNDEKAQEKKVLFEEKWLITKLKGVFFHTSEPLAISLPLPHSTVLEAWKYC